jgi:hypothetical protein
VTDLFGPAIMTFCERALASFPMYPADTWSNVGPIAAGLFVWRRALRDGRRDLRPLGIAGVVLGICSAVFHGTGTRLGELLDLAAMSGFVAAVFWLAWQRAYPFRRAEGLALATGLVVASVLAAVFAPTMGIPVFLALVAAAIALEARASRRLGRSLWQSRAFLWILPTMALALTAWLLDFHHVVCDPDNHILSLHAVWHLLNGVPILLLYHHQRSFPRPAPRG